MGDSFITIVDETANEDEAKLLSKRVLEWLVAENIVESEPSDCILSKDPGYRPGSNCRRAINMSEPGIEKYVDLLQRLVVNGLEIVMERTIFHAGGSGLTLVCKQCGTSHDEGEVIEAWGDAVDEWFMKSGEGLVTCPVCGTVRPVTEWSYDPPFGFGCLGFQFWNWPMLSPSFIQDVERILGHPTKLVSGKL